MYFKKLRLLQAKYGIRCQMPKVQVSQMYSFDISNLIYSCFARYKCHKACARNAPFSCGLPPELEEYFRKRVLCYNNAEPSSPPIPLTDVFPIPIQDLTKEPSQGMLCSKLHVQQSLICYLTSRPI